MSSILSSPARPPVVCICGAKKSGKTLLMARLVRHLSELGLAVGTLKHDGHDFDLGRSQDREGTDSWRHRAAGARASAVFSARRWALFRDGEPELETLLDLMSDMDLILAEGLKELGMSGAPEELNVVLMCHNATRDFAEYLQQAYKTRLGVDLELDPVEWPVFQERNRNLDYQMGYKSYYADFNDPSSMMDLWITGTRTIPTGWSNERYDALVREAGQSADKALRAKDYTEAERILLEEGTIAPYAYSTGFDYVHPYVKGYAAPTFTAMLYKTVSVER